LQQQAPTLTRPVLPSGDRAKGARLPDIVTSPVTPPTPVVSVDDRVLSYLSDHHGEISITRAAQDLGINLQQLTESLSRLQSRGLIQKESAFVERMRNCVSCKRTIGADEPFCSYCGIKQVAVKKETQALDPHTMKVTLTMLSRVIEAKDHPEYSEIDQLTTTIGKVALGGEKPQDAQELSFQDQLRLLTLVFEYSRDKVVYKGETFGEHVRWPWETIKTGGDCDCKVVLLASMLASLAFRRMYVLVLPAGTYVDTETNKERSMQGHAILEVELSDKGRRVPVRLDPSCADCDVDEMAAPVEPLLSNFYRVPIIP
jgi:Mn-dependent DtxR family transcriptional regulator